MSWFWPEEDVIRTWSTTSCNFLGTKGKAHSHVRAAWQKERSENSENVHKDNSWTHGHSYNDCLFSYLITVPSKLLLS